MAEFRVALGATMDVVSPGELNDAIAGLQGHMDRNRPRDRALPLRRPITASQQLVFAGATDPPISIPLVPSGPALGRIWSVASITILGADDGTAVSNLKAAVYIGDSSNPILGDCVIPQQSIPFFDTFSYPDIWVQDQRDLFVRFVPSGAVTTNVIINAWVMDFTDDTAQQQRL